MFSLKERKARGTDYIIYLKDQLLLGTIRTDIYQ